MFSSAIQKADMKFNSRDSRIAVRYSDALNLLQRRMLLERLDYLGINAAFLDCNEDGSFILIEIKSVELFTIKRCKKVIETLYLGSDASIESIGGIAYKEYVYAIGA